MSKDDVRVCMRKSAKNCMYTTKRKLQCVCSRGEVWTCQEFLWSADMWIPLCGYICVALEARQQGVTVVLWARAELTAH